MDAAATIDAEYVVRANPAFEHGDFYRGPDDDYLTLRPAAPSPYPLINLPLNVLGENHTLIASDDAANWNARRDMWKFLEAK